MGLTRSTPYNAKTSSAGRFMGFNRIAGAEGDHDTQYMTRLWFGRLRLHIFHRGDGDPDCHDHPWDFWTFPLTSYVEEVARPIRETIPIGRNDPPARFYKTQEVVRAWRWNYRPAEHCHRVIGPYAGTYGGPHERALNPTVKPGKIVTIVWRGAPRRKWGFLKDRAGRWCWIGWKEYVFNGGKAAPCKD